MMSSPEAPDLALRHERQKVQAQVFGDRLNAFFRASPAEKLSQTLPL
jgi:hypothetical protein